MTVALKHIAKGTGYSMSTVSAILGGRAHLHSKTTQSRVMEIAEKLGYQANSGARAMRRGSFGAVALVMGPEGHTYLPQDLLAGIEETLAREGLNLIIVRVSEENLQSPEKIPHVLRERMVDGLLINYILKVPPRLTELVNQRNCPAVWINDKQDHDSVYPDDFRAGMELTQALLDIGHRRIGYIDFSETVHYSRNERMRGYSECMLAAGLEPEVSFYPVMRSGSSFGDQAFRNWMTFPRRPTALISYYPPTALLYAAKTEYGLEVPRDLSVVTFSDRPDCSLGLEIGCMLLPEYEIGVNAVQMLLGKLAARKTKMISKSFPGKFYPGDTCGAPSC
ncbi:MAG TPA: hypothetical protein DCZ94_02130 [Lentisphaeria bacterium]|nr:hypothetical protein [Lentisphaeria bacterium]